MLFFSKNKKKLKEKEAAFNKKLREANKIMDSLDFNIAEFKRKYMNLQMRGRKAQSIAELERMLYEMHMQAEQAEKAVKELELEHEDCVAIVDKLIDEFEQTVGGLPE